MPDERRPAAAEAEDQPKVVDRRRFRPDGDPVDDAPEDAGAGAGPPAPALDERDDRFTAQAARLDELTRAYAALLEDNKAFRQRQERERERVIEAERAEVAQALLEATDDLERALSAVGGDVEGELGSLVEGVRLSLDVLHRRIAKLGAQRIPVVGQPFDPHVAEAIDAVPVADAALDGFVLQEISPGYRIGDRVLRPARVRVGRIARA